VAVGLAGFLLRDAVPMPKLGSTVVGLLFIGLAVLLAVAVNVCGTRLEAFLKGAKGEERVARELAFLPADHSVFHGLAAARAAIMPHGGDYDHVIVCRAGVFLVETKNWSGRITVENGRVLYDGREPDRPPLEQVKGAAARLKRQVREACGLDVTVHPVLCFAADTLAGGNQGVGGVVVCNARSINAVLTDTVEQALPAPAQVAICGFLRGLAGSED
jgi:hypothetical protein